jgi:endonuclease/exonuclease/phosphatase family metal-dependent hydrolase
VYGKNAVYEHGHHGNSILSRYPVKRWHNQDVSTNWLESRGALHAVVDVEGVELHVVNSHLSLFENGRRNQVRLLANRIRSEIPAGSPFVVAGDFNDWRGTAGELFERMLGVSDAFSHTKGQYARSFPAIIPILSLDRVYFSGLHCTRAHALSGLPWTRFSDHLPLLVEFTLD